MINLWLIISHLQSLPKFRKFLVLYRICHVVPVIAVCGADKMDTESSEYLTLLSFQQENTKKSIPLP